MSDILDETNEPYTRSCFAYRPSFYLLKSYVIFALIFYYYLSQKKCTTLKLQIDSEELS